VTHFYSGCIAIELKLPKHTEEKLLPLFIHMHLTKKCVVNNSLSVNWLLSALNKQKTSFTSRLASSRHHNSGRLSQTAGIEFSQWGQLTKRTIANNV